MSKNRGREVHTLKIKKMAHRPLLHTETLWLVNKIRIPKYLSDEKPSK